VTTSANYVLLLYIFFQNSNVVWSINTTMINSCKNIPRSLHCHASNNELCGENNCLCYAPWRV